LENKQAETVRNEIFRCFSAPSARSQNEAINRGQEANAVRWQSHRAEQRFEELKDIEARVSRRSSCSERGNTSASPRRKRRQLEKQREKLKKESAAIEEKRSGARRR